MSKSIKLSPKQFAAISAIETQKQQLANMVQDANNKQNLVVELAFEAAGIDVSTIEQVKLEGDCLVYEEKKVDFSKPVKAVSKSKKTAEAVA